MKSHDGRLGRTGSAARPAVSSRLFTQPPSNLAQPRVPLATTSKRLSHLEGPQNRHPNGNSSLWRYLKPPMADVRYLCQRGTSSEQATVRLHSTSEQRGSVLNGGHHIRTSSQQMSSPR